MRTCTRCGAPFTAPSSSRQGGRPRSRCDGCRSNHDRIDGAVWNRLRAEVLRAQPVCSVLGCYEFSTTVDHIIPLKHAPHLGLERSNLQGMCGRHNASKGARVASWDDYISPAASPAGMSRCRHCDNPECPRRWHL